MAFLRSEDRGASQPRCVAGLRYWSAKPGHASSRCGRRRWLQEVVGKPFLVSDRTGTRAVWSGRTLERLPLPPRPLACRRATQNHVCWPVAPARQPALFVILPKLTTEPRRACDARTRTEISSKPGTPDAEGLETPGFATRHARLLVVRLLFGPLALPRGPSPFPLLVSCRSPSSPGRPGSVLRLSRSGWRILLGFSEFAAAVPLSRSARGGARPGRGPASPGRPGTNGRPPDVTLTSDRLYSSSPPTSPTSSATRLSALAQAYSGVSNRRARVPKPLLQSVSVFRDGYETGYAPRTAQQLADARDRREQKAGEKWQQEVEEEANASLVPEWVREQAAEQKKGRKR